MSARFAAREEFRDGREGRGRARARTIFRIPNGDYAIQVYCPRSAINCFYCKKDAHGWRDCIFYLATKEGKK